MFVVCIKEFQLISLMIMGVLEWPVSPPACIIKYYYYHIISTYHIKSELYCILSTRDQAVNENKSFGRHALIYEM